MRAGKTKILTPLWEGADIAGATAKNDLTAFDGDMHDIMVGKAELATRTTCNVFEYLRGYDVPMAYIGRDGPTTFLTRICDMIPVEVVVRNVAVGSYLKRNPHVAKGTVFAHPLVEYNYKTSGKKVRHVELPCDDPLMYWNDQQDGFDLYLPDKPQAEGYIGCLPIYSADALSLKSDLDTCAEMARVINKSLSQAWESLDGALYDFKIEFGKLPDGTIVLADVLDCDSWRVMWHGLQLSKQPYRDKESLVKVFGAYRLAASLTDRLV